MNPLIWPIIIPIAAGLLALCVPRGLARPVKWLAILAMAATFGICVALYAGETPAPYTCAAATLLELDGLGGLILLGVGFFSLLMTVYSAGFFGPGAVSEGYIYGNLLLSAGAACGVALSSNLVLLAVFWGLLGIPLYLLINAGSKGAAAAAKKTLLILGGTDSVLLLGVAAFFVSTGGSFNMLGLAQPLSLTSTAAGAASATPAGAFWFGLVCFIIAALAKAGAMPFHTWVPDACETAPVPAVAMLPASLDKLLGIYLLVRVFHTMYMIPDGVRIACLLLGAGTIVFAVMNAMVQHNLRRLLGFHAVSQVGYMVVGIATGTAIGVVGALFHMFNNAIYKSCLFLAAGAAEKKTGETELDKMGGLAKVMPLTFLAALVSAFAISGIPPLNGFASKWMIYNGIIAAQNLGFVWVIVLVAAMFGSALTLASFVKVLHSVFLGQPKKLEREGANPGFLMKVPMAVLAVLCVVLGVFAVRLGVRQLILPAVPFDEAAFNETLSGLWSSGVATVLLLVALVVGVIVYLLSTFAKVREDEAYIGGEVGRHAEMYNFEGVEFYKTVREMPLLESLYRQAEAKWYDIYEQLRRLTFYVTGWLRKAHDGVLHSYVMWCVVGLVVILWCLMYSYGILGRAF